MEDINSKFKHIFKIASSDSFIQKKSLGGEIPFFISAYDATNELEIQKAIKGLKKKLQNNGRKVLDLNLYDIIIDIYQEKAMLNMMFNVEKKKSKDKFLRALQSSLNIHEVLMPKISQLINEAKADINFITGIGLVYPYIRSHTILNNLQNIAKDAPTIIFFPGKYDGNSLNLFGLLKVDNYYRAFNIDTIKNNYDIKRNF